MFLRGRIFGPQHNPPPGGPDPRIYITSRQGNVVVSLDTGYAFRLPLTTRVSYGRAALIPGHHTGIRVNVNAHTYN
jgi:hypothetical protein